MEYSHKKDKNATLRPDTLTKQINYECISPIPVSSSGIQLSSYPYNLTVLNSPMDENLQSTTYTTPKISKNNTSAGPAALYEIPENIMGNISPNPLSLDCNASNQLVLVPLSILNLFFQ